MAQLHRPFDASSVEPTSPLDPIPAGEYPMAIVESEMKPTKNRDGEYLQLVCEVIDGPMKGRKVWERLNLVNGNATAVSIAESTLSAICRAVGVVHVQDSNELHHRPFMGKVKFVPASGQYDAKNEMAGYKALSGAPASPTPAQQASAPPSAQPASQPAAASSPPWKRAS